MTENGFENSGLIHHELRNGMYFFRVFCAVKMAGILVVHKQLCVDAQCWIIFVLFLS